MTHSFDNVSSKQALAGSFGKAAQSYDDAAGLQRQVGFRLLSELSQVKPLTNSPLVMDLGCGTGFFAKPLVESLKPSALLSTDISEEMLATARLRVEREIDSNLSVAFEVADAESLSFSNDLCDVVYSSLALQWVSDLEATLSGIERILKPGGIVAFSTLLDSTLWELKESWSVVDSEQHVNSFMTKDECLQAGKSSGMELVTAKDESIIMPFEKPIDVMKSLKAIGAHNISAKRPKGLTGRARLQKVLSKYESFRASDGVIPATYHAGYFIFRKKS